MKHDTPVKIFVVNDYITMKFINNRTEIYINGKYYRQCLRLILTTTPGRLNHSESIDQIELSSSKTYDELLIDPEEEFMVHCSNMQAFAENNYDTRLLHRSLALPLLKKLYDEGDELAKRVLFTDLMRRCEEGHPKTIIYLIENKYEDYIHDWFVSQLRDPNSKLIRNLTDWIVGDDPNAFEFALSVFKEFSIKESTRVLIMEKIKKKAFTLPSGINKLIRLNITLKQRNPTPTS